jgi:hypothetical protein
MNDSFENLKQKFQSNTQKASEEYKEQLFSSLELMYRKNNINTIQNNNLSIRNFMSNFTKYFYTSIAILAILSVLAFSYNIWITTTNNNSNIISQVFNISDVKAAYEKSLEKNIVYRKVTVVAGKDLEYIGNKYPKYMGYISTQLKETISYEEWETGTDQKGYTSLAKSGDQSILNMNGKYYEKASDVFANVYHGAEPSTTSYLISILGKKGVITNQKIATFDISVMPQDLNTAEVGTMGRVYTISPISENEYQTQKVTYYFVGDDHKAYEYRVDTFSGYVNINPSEYANIFLTDELKPDENSDTKTTDSTNVVCWNYVKEETVQGKTYLYWNDLNAGLPVSLRKQVPSSPAILNLTKEEEALYNTWKSNGKPMPNDCQEVPNTTEQDINHAEDGSTICWNNVVQVNNTSVEWFNSKKGAIQMTYTTEPILGREAGYKLSAKESDGYSKYLNDWIGQGKKVLSECQRSGEDNFKDKY